MTGYESKKAAAQDKMVVTDLDGHVVRGVRKPKKAAAQEPDWKALVLEHNADCDSRCDMDVCGYKGHFEFSNRRCPTCPVKQKIDVNYATQPAQKPVAYEYFKEWMVKEMPPMTTIGNPEWWAKRIYDKFIYSTQPTQEPVAWYHAEDFKTHFTTGPSEDLVKSEYWQPLYTTPPQPAQEPVALECTYGYSQCQALAVAQQKRPWVGLTDEETSGFTSHEMAVVKYVSKVLQEKNT